MEQLRKHTIHHSRHVPLLFPSQPQPWPTYVQPGKETAFYIMDVLATVLTPNFPDDYLK